MPISKLKWEPVNAEYCIKPLYTTSTVESFKHLRSLRLLNLNSGKAHFSMDMQRHLNMNPRCYKISFFVLLWCRPQEHNCVSHYKTKAPLSITNSKQQWLKRRASGSDLHITEHGVSQVSEQFSSYFLG